jgi:hypothetical protein
MTHDEIAAEMKRSLGQEMSLMDTESDAVRVKRNVIVDKLMTTVGTIDLDPTDDPDTQKVKLKVMEVALKALDGVEKSRVSTVSIKMRQQEQEVATAQASKDRIAVMLASAARGQLPTTSHDPAAIAAAIDAFDASVQDFELRASHQDISD